MPQAPLAWDAPSVIEPHRGTPLPTLYRLRVTGLVQGVGFRPTVWRVAQSLGLSGWVRNDGHGVVAVVHGPSAPGFVTALQAALPPLARVDEWLVLPEGSPPAPGFHILESDAGPVQTAIGPDAAVCPDCMTDICEPANRRWRHAFCTCTHCGPRYTVTAGLPYDRARTSLSRFPLCPDCEREYRDPADRRFHAETTCCPQCGPKLQLLDAYGMPLDGDPIAGALARLHAGQIVAIMGLGGFHLACLANHAPAVQRLRKQKNRARKPLAVMVLNPSSAHGLATVDALAAKRLHAVDAPIVLCPQAPDAPVGLAPGLAWLGLMLPATPLHLLLWHEAAGRPEGTAWLKAPHPLQLVMTSANPGGEPLVTSPQEALTRLKGLADAFLVHDRAVVVRCDDTLLRPGANGESVLMRRARGHAPTPITLNQDGPTVLAMGALLKNTVCVIKGREAQVSQHIGSLDNVATMNFQEEVITHLCSILEARPALIAHDLHPDDPAAQLGQRLAQEWGVPTFGIGHHEAHLAAVAAEHGLDDLVGLTLDGTGYGPDGQWWGGELLHLQGVLCHRLGRLRPLALPGGDRAAREPWRMAVSALHSAGRSASDIQAWCAWRWPHVDPRPLITMLERQLRCPPSSSLGRVFDAAAALLGITAVNDFEGDAAMRLESLAYRQSTLPRRIPLQADTSDLDLRPLLLELAHETDPGQGALNFHHSLAHALSDWAMVQRPGLRVLALTGGCAQNLTLVRAMADALSEHGCQLCLPKALPPNDGGLSLGQAWLARGRALAAENPHR